MGMTNVECPHEARLDQISRDVAEVRKAVGGNGSPERGLSSRLVVLENGFIKLTKVEQDLAQVNIRTMASENILSQINWFVKVGVTAIIGIATMGMGAGIVWIIRSMGTA